MNSNQARVRRMDAITIRKLFRAGSLLLILIFNVGQTGVSLAQNVTGNIIVSGTVVSHDSGEPLPGVNVLIEGTQRGAVTNENGEYELAVPAADATLLFSFVGFESQSIRVEGRRVINVVLAETVEMTEDLVVIGYGTQQRSEITTAIASVSAEELTRNVNTTIEQALQGKVAGINVTSNDGTPGGGLSVEVRGIGTIGNSSPLYVIDGVPGGDINAISPDNIASIDILKDAASAAIYGANGANGVVLITTKSGGDVDGARVSLSSTIGMQQLGHTMDMLDAEQYASLQNEARSNSGLPTYWDDPISLGTGTDWQRALAREALLQKYDLSVSGGSDQASYFLSGNYLNQEGTLLGSGFERVSLRANADYRVSNLLRIGNRIGLSRTDQSTIPTDYPFATDNRIVAALEMAPVVPVYRDGQFAGPLGDQEGSSQGPNPVGLATINSVANKSTGVNERAFVELTPIKGLEIRSDLGVDFNYGDYRSFYPTYRWGITSNSIANLSTSNSTFYSWMAQTAATYTRILGTDHFLKMLIGASFGADRYESKDASAQGFASEDVTTISAADQILSTGEFIEEASSVGYFGRINYDYLNRYLFSVNLRIDGSSRFAADNRYGIFPSFSAGWRVSEEPFMQSIGAISELKLRASWGRAGNSEIGNYNYLARLNLAQYYVLGDDQNVVTGVAPGSIPNTDVKWETTSQTDFGMDLGLLNNRLEMVADYYRKNTYDMLVPLPIPASSGIVNAPYQNAGEVLNEGVELAANYADRAGAFGYRFGFNITTVRNEVLSLGGGLPIGSPILYRESVRLTRTAEGRPMGSFFGYKTNGLFQNQQEIEAHAEQPGAQPGDIRFVDVNGDGFITDDDRTYIGSPIPDFTYGFNGGFSFRNVAVDFSIYGVQGNQVMNTMGYRLMNGSFVGNKMASVLDRWTGPGTSNEMPRLTWDDPNDNARISDRYVEDGSYLRLKNVRLTYTLPARLNRSLQVRDVRVFASAENLFTISGYSGLDPELGKVDNNNLNYGIDMGNYPVVRTYSIGVNLVF